MIYRAAIVLLQDNKIALIERQRAGMHYFTFPGGHVEPGETPEQAAVRETKEELGLAISIRRLLAEMRWREQQQYYYLVEVVSGDFGTGMGEEMVSSDPGRGSYVPAWIPLQDLLGLPILPRSMAELVVAAQSAGWPDTPKILRDEE